MIKQASLIVFFLFFGLCLKAQTNLIIDGSFEDATADSFGSYFWWSVNQWKNPNQYGTPTPTPDYYNDLANGTVRPSNDVIMHQPPKDGYGLVGLIVIHKDYPDIAREYVQGTLSKELEAGKKYEVKFYVSLVNNYRVAVSHLGAYLSTEPITFTFRCELEPHVESNTILSDTLNWMEIKGEYIAQGGEKHITLGNFRDDKQSDTLVLPVGVNVSPLLHSYYFLDDVSVVCLDCPIDEIGVGIAKTQQKTEIKIYPNPTSNTLNVAVLTNMPQNVNVSVYNMMGELIETRETLTNKGFISLNTYNYPSGIYVCKIINTNNEVLETKKIFVNHE